MRDYAPTQLESSRTELLFADRTGTREPWMRRRRGLVWKARSGEEMGVPLLGCGACGGCRRGRCPRRHGKRHGASAGALGPGGKPPSGRPTTRPRRP